MNTVFSHYCTANSEPDAPENFTVTSSGSTSVHASWDEPLDSNGVIISFSLTVSLSPNQEYLPDPDTPRYTGLDPNLVKLDIGQLHPFANYFFTLTAATSFGPGNLTDASEMTNEAGNCVSNFVWINYIYMLLVHTYMYTHTCTCTSS